MRPFHFGVVVDQNMPWADTLERFRYAERLGLDSAWVCDHFVQPSRPTYPGGYLEGWTLLAALAARTERIRLGVLVSSNTFRHPALLAKQAVTVDHVSNGRLEIGLGAGWYEPEHVMYGLDFPGPGELVDRYREAVQIVDGLLRHEVLSYQGRHYQLHDATFRPAPLQRPRPPLTLGAHGPRMLRIVAEHADRWNSFGTVEEMAKRNDLLDEHCARIGRDADSIARSLYGWASMMPRDPFASVDAFAEMVERYRGAGVHEFLVDLPAPTQYPVLERVVSDLVPKLRAG
ncbi:MAG TPA: TIGR03560 family F420-dependent LLM class oxidoreductase [Chloroflexota bacterium]|nr:TIGR03560 family F420-dependent LLM class oxidoreductase [Chloroflexota bacterium]